MDIVYKYLLSLGYSSKDIHNKKPNDKVKLISIKLRISKTPSLPKRQARKFLYEFASLETRNKDTFSLLMALHVSRYESIRGPSKKVDEHTLTISNLPGAKFYKSKEWQELRYKALKHYGNKCHLCGRSPKDGVVIHVDHILPRSIYPEFALVFNNLQILCDDCNHGKGNWDETDHR